MGHKLRATPNFLRMCAYSLQIAHHQNGFQFRTSPGCSSPAQEDPEIGRGCCEQNCSWRGMWYLLCSLIVSLKTCSSTLWVCCMHFISPGDPETSKCNQRNAWKQAKWNPMTICYACSLTSYTLWRERKGLVTLQPSSWHHSRNLLWPMRSVLFIDCIRYHGVAIMSCV